MKLNDERVRFYLRHRDQLEEWWNLRSEVGAAFDEWMFSLAPQIEALGSDLGPDLDFVRSGPDSGWPAFYLQRRAWPGAGSAEIAIGVQWNPGKTLLTASNTPYIGVRCERSSPVGRGLRDDASFQSVRRRRKDAVTQYWAAYAFIEPHRTFPEELEAYEQALIDAIRDAWNAYAPLIDAVVGRGATGTGP